MGKPSLILAALAADAMPGVSFNRIFDLTRPESGINSALLVSEADNVEVVVKVPTTNNAAADLIGEVQALKALRSAGQGALSFSVPALVGESSANAAQKALLFSYVAGEPFELRSNRTKDELTASLVGALSQIHALPTSIVSNANLPEYTPAENVRARLAELDRVVETRKIKQPLLQRWFDALEDANLFRYQPTVIHGNLTSDSVLTEGTQVVGVVDWSALRVDDPAYDVAFVFELANPEDSYSALLQYEALGKSDPNIRQRTVLYSELVWVRYLAWAISMGTEDDVLHATEKLDELFLRLSDGTVPDLTATGFAKVETQPERLPEPQAEFVAEPASTPPFQATSAMPATENLEVIDLSENN